MFFLIMFCIALSLSYFLLWLIYRKAFQSKKKISKFLVFLGSIGLIIFYYTPYSFYLEPSFWQVRNMCKLNELPNDEEKYNKILRYFDTDLDSLDWEELNREAEMFFQLKTKVIDTKKNTTNFSNRQPIKNGRILYNFVLLYRNKNINSIRDLESIKLIARWHTRRYNLEQKSMASYELKWREEELSCSYFGINLRSEL